jgi:hypothetical protein
MSAHTDYYFPVIPQYLGNCTLIYRAKEGGHSHATYTEVLKQNHLLV